MARNGRVKRGLRAYVELFPPLRWALKVDDCFRAAVKCICRSLKSFLLFIFDIVWQGLKLVCTPVEHLTSGLFRRVPYQRLDQKDKRDKRSKSHWEPIPYRNQLLGRILTYHGSLLLGSLLFAFVYYVLVKHHTFTNLGIAFLFFIAYLLILENSHNIRSIMMLCLPIMFSNRGRALIFCVMLSMTVSGPAKNTQSNIGELHSSLNCCKQYLLVKSDRYIEENVIEGMVKVEDAVYKMIDEIKKFADELREKFRVILQLAITVSLYIQEGLKKLLEIVNICNKQSQEVNQNCIKTFENAYNDCRYKLGSEFDFLCEIVSPLKGTCVLTQIPREFCKLPAALVKFLDETIGERLRQFLLVIENELYVEINVVHDYSYDTNKSKQYNVVYSEIKRDIDNKFWLLHMIARAFNLITLVLVIWITLSATVYHMHYLTELSYDNMYLDQYLEVIDARRKDKHAGRANGSTTLVTPKRSLELESDDDQDSKRISIGADASPIAQASSQSPTNSGPDTRTGKETQWSDTNENVGNQKYLFPMTQRHERQYLKPFSWRMNHVEKTKVKVAMLVWSVIVCYILFFVLFDFAFYRLINLIDALLKDLIFSEEIPIVEISSQSGDEIVVYNRTYLHQLRMKAKEPKHLELSPNRTSSINEMYRRLMDSLEENIPDDLVILDSLKTCLPKPSKPNLRIYNGLLLLGGITFIAVFIEAYALRTRHCIANLYYPRRARARAVWLYKRLLAEKPKFENPEKLLRTSRQDNLIDLE